MLTVMSTTKLALASFIKPFIKSSHRKGNRIFQSAGKEKKKMGLKKRGMFKTLCALQ